MIAQIQVRRGTTVEWAAADPVILAAGEPGYDTTLKIFKIGDGSTAWSNLPNVQNVVNAELYGVTGDGVTDDAASLAAAITAAAGKILLLPRGTILVNSQITVAAVMTIDGNGSTILSGLASPATVYTPLILVTADDVAIKDLTVDCDGNNHVGIEATGTDGFSLVNCHVLNAGEKSSFWLQECTNAIVRDCTATGNAKTQADGGSRLGAFYLAGCQHIIVDNCRVLDWYGKGFSTNSKIELVGFTPTVVSYDVWFTRCRVDGSGLDGPEGAETVFNTPRSESVGLYFGYYQENSGARDCHIYDVDIGMKFSYATTACVVDACTFIDCRNVTSMIQGCLDCVLSKSRIEYNVATVEGDVIPYYDYAVSIESHATIGGATPPLGSIRNRVIYCSFDMDANTVATSAAVYIKQNYSEDNTVEGCNFINCQRGVYVNAPSTRITGNIFNASAGSSILFNNTPSYSHVCRNTFQDPAEYAIELVPSGQIIGISILDNTIIGGLGDGIYLSNIQHSDCSNNHLFRVSEVNTDVGIVVAEPVDRTVINNNVISNYRGYAINHTDATSLGLVMNGNIGYYGGIVFAAVTGKCIGNSCHTAGVVAVSANPGIESYGNGVAGAGLTVITPDGTETWRIAVDNAGAVTTAQIT